MMRTTYGARPIDGAGVPERRSPFETWRIPKVPVGDTPHTTRGVVRHGRRS